MREPHTENAGADAVFKARWCPFLCKFLIRRNKTRALLAETEVESGVAAERIVITGDDRQSENGSHGLEAVGLMDQSRGIVLVRHGLRMGDHIRRLPDLFLRHGGDPAHLGKVEGTDILCVFLETVDIFLDIGLIMPIVSDDQPAMPLASRPSVPGFTRRCRSAARCAAGVTRGSTMMTLPPRRLNSSMLLAVLKRA